MESSSRGARDTRTAYPALLALAIALRLFLVLATPFGQKVSHRIEGLNDEPAHLNYVRYLTSHRAFPVQTHHYREPGAFARGDFEYYQPPLYYTFCAPLAAAVGARRTPYVCRLVSFACGLLSLVILGRIFTRLGCPAAWRRTGILFVAFLPTHAYFSSLASNDSLSWLIGLLLTNEMVGLVGSECAVTGVPSLAAGVRLGLLLASGMLTKSNLSLFIPVLVIVYAYLALAARRMRSAVSVVVPLGVMLALAGPWYWRNLLLCGSPRDVGEVDQRPEDFLQVRPNLSDVEFTHRFLQ